MYTAKLPTLALAGLACAVTAAYAVDTVFYAGGDGNQRFNGVHELSDGTVLVSGLADSMAWLPDAAPVTEIAADGIDSSAAGRYGFLLHLSADLGEVLRAMHFPQGTVEDINHIRTTEVPGDPTGDLYISGRRAGGSTQGYFVARLDNNFVNGVPAGLVWAQNIEALRQYRDIQPWDVRGDGKVVAASGDNNRWDPAFFLMLGADDGEPVVVEGWRRHYRASGGFWEGGPASAYPDHDTDPLTHSVHMLNANSHGGLRSRTQEDFDAIEFDGHDGVRMGRYPDDLYLAGPNTTSGRGYTGYRMTSSSYGLGQIAVDRRNNHLYFGGNVQTNHAGNLPDFELHAAALDEDGNMKWWNRLYTSMRSGDGISRTTNAAASWSASNSGLGNPHVRALAIDPADFSVVYAGTYGGIYKSTDGGATWASANTGLDADWILDIQIAATDTSVVYAATNKGVFKSTDSGATWAHAHDGITYAYVNTLAVHPDDPGTVYAGTAGHGLFKTTDGGATWTARNTGLTGDDNNLWINAVVLDPVDPDTVYLGSAGGNGVSRSTDGGTTWNAANSNLSTAGRYVFTLAVHRADAGTPATLYLGCIQGVYRSTDGAATWTAAYGDERSVWIGYRGNNGNTGTLGNVRALVIHPDDPGTVYAGHAYFGAFKTTDGGASWSRVVSGLPSLPNTIGFLHNMVFALALDPVDPDILLLGCLGRPQASIPDQYVDSVAVDYSAPPGETLIGVIARHHGNDHSNLWRGDNINPDNNPDHPGTSYHNGFTGTSGNLHLSWIGKLADDDGRLMYSTRLAENPDQTNWGARFPNDHIHYGWPNPNAGWPNLNTTRTFGRTPMFDNEGRLLVVAQGRRTHTTRNAYQRMPNPSRVASVTAVTSAQVFRSDALVGNTEIRGGVSEITMTSAPNNNVTRTIAAFQPATGEITLDAPLNNTPAAGNSFRIIEGVSSWNNFVRVFSRDFTTLEYSSLLTGEWDTSLASGADNIDLLSVVPSNNGLLLAGYHRVDTEGHPRGHPMPTQNIPAWGMHLPDAESPVLARLHYTRDVDVTVTSPLARSSFFDSETVTVEAFARAAAGGIERVEFFVGETMIGESTAAPHSLTWSAPTPGVHLLRAVAHTDGGLTGDSPNVALEIIVTPDIPATPVDFEAISVAASAVTLEWAPGSGDEAAYHIERATGTGGTWDEIAVVEAPQTSYSDTSVEAETAYQYRVRASNVSGSSPYSTVITVNVPAVAEIFLRINFQTSNVTPPAGWLVDSGDAFGDRGNGEIYGWTGSPGDTRARNNSNSPDMMHDTLIHTTGAVWEIAVPNGDYEVRVVSGDPNHFDSVYQTTVQGTLTVDGTPTSGNRWIEGTVLVSVDDGRIRVADGPAASNNKLCFIEISRVPDAPDETAFATWIADPALGVPEDQRGPLDAPFGDNMANIVKFALGIPPMADGSHALPHAERESTGDAEYLVFVFRQRTGGTGTPGIDYTVDGVSYRAEASASLGEGTWHSGGDWFELDGPPVDNGDGTETVYLRLKEPVAPGAPKFIRLRIDGE
ncbi:MAG: hypothetical protein JJU00_18155 [Opitutales bacterium]|nr:hypothetical protein [Opitutales bacterium]